jgi:HEPN domain-containing protein
MPPERTDEKNPADWFYLAQDRLKIADLAWQREGLTPAGVELLQEAVERYLKGYLVSQGWRLVKTHDLERLVSEAAAYDPKFQQFALLADELNRDFFTQHYPGGDWTDFGVNYEKLRADAGRLIELIVAVLPKYFPKLPAT